MKSLSCHIRKRGRWQTTTSANVGTGLAMLGEKVILDRYRYRSQESRRGDGTGEPHRLQPCGRRAGELPSEAGTDKGQKISEPVFHFRPPRPGTSSSVTPGQMRKLVDDLRERDYVLLDCPAGIEQGFNDAIAGADRAFVVTTPEVSATPVTRPGSSAGRRRKKSRRWISS